VRVRKAVLPAAGFGTRFLPATKSIPKEIMPLVDRPIIQYAVEEAVASGIEQIIIVIATGRSAIEDHFDSSPSLERWLEERGDIQMLRTIRRISEFGTVAFVHQREQLGLGHAVLMAKDLVGEEPFAVLLSDDVMLNPSGAPVTARSSPSSACLPPTSVATGSSSRCTRRAAWSRFATSSRSPRSTTHRPTSPSSAATS
jgi:UTP-glucose-1-phosphate uridylyltransferase